MNACSLFCKAVSPCTCKSLYSFRLMKLKNHQFLAKFESSILTKFWKIFINCQNLKIIYFCQKSHKIEKSSILQKFEKSSVIPKLKNLQFWPYFKILSFYHLKNLQIWTNHTKITLLQFCQIWKNIKFCQNLKNLHLNKFW